MPGEGAAPAILLAIFSSANVNDGRQFGVLWPSLGDSKVSACGFRKSHIEYIRPVVDIGSGVRIFVVKIASI